MASIAQKQLFGWDEIEILGDLERFFLVIKNLPDEKIIRTLKAIRGNGTNKYSIEAMWNSILAAIIFQHKSIESLRRELSRNAQLRELCGFNNFYGIQAIPSARAYTTFLIPDQ